MAARNLRSHLESAAPVVIEPQISFLTTIVEYDDTTAAACGRKKGENADMISNMVAELKFGQNGFMCQMLCCVLLRHITNGHFHNEMAVIIIWAVQ